MSIKLVIATHNADKLREARAICERCALGLEVVGASELGAAPAAETGDTYEENATLKACSVAGPHVIAIGEDSGLEVGALCGKPGVLSARYGGSLDGAARNELVLRQLGNTSRRRARFVAVCVILFPDGTRVTVTGACEGEIVFAPRGSGGFGYDPIFMPRGHDKTMAELMPEEKNDISHRKVAWEQAMTAILTWLESRTWTGS